MKRLIKLMAVFMLMVLGSAMALAQEKETPKEPPRPREYPVYKLDFVIAELEDGKRVNTRAYSMMIMETRNGTINVATRVPVLTGSGGPSPQFQYMDVGLNLEYSLWEQGNMVVVNGRTRIDSFADTQPQSGAANMPVTRRISADGQAAVVPGRPTIISSVDDVNSKKRYEIQVTATKIK